MAADIRETGKELMVKFDANGLVPAIVQDAQSGAVLMMAWLNDEALRLTIQTRKATFFSRSRNKIWVKGESSGHTQEVTDLRIDCDQDCLIMKVKSHGPACHGGYPTCFYRSVDFASGELKFVEEKVFDPEKVYKK